MNGKKHMYDDVIKFTKNFSNIHPLGNTYFDYIGEGIVKKSCFLATKGDVYG